jgi:hypothetical protein
MIWLTEDDMVNKEFLAYLTVFLISEEVMHFFTIEETTILNSSGFSGVLFIRKRQRGNFL